MNWMDCLGVVEDPHHRHLQDLVRPSSTKDMYTWGKETVALGQMVELASEGHFSL